MKQNKELSPTQWIILEKLVKAITYFFLLILHLRETSLCYNLQDHFTVVLIFVGLLTMLL